MYAVPGSKDSMCLLALRKETEFLGQSLRSSVQRMGVCECLNYLSDEALFQYGMNCLCTYVTEWVCVLRLNLYLVLSVSGSFTLGEILLKILFRQCVARVLCT